MRLFSHDVKVERLGKAPLFQGLSKKELSALARVTDDLEVQPGTVLCKEGSLGQEFFVVVDGEVDVTRHGKKQSFRGGQFFGEIALLTPTAKRTATVTAKTPLRVFVLTRGSFRAVLDENPKLERKVLDTLAERLASYSEDV